MQRIFVLTGLVAFSLFAAGPALAHTPLCSCYDNGDGTITCEGGFSDGSSAAGVTMRVVDAAGKVLIQGQMNEDSEFTCEKPDGLYKVELDAGPGHLVEVKGEDIVE
ncbi:MAG: hypothetical protein JW883_12710 [Deltaproteobacteria bacterium]|nr:hypothetical protein [Deltaproteobacteria bacterium]